MNLRGRAITSVGIAVLVATGVGPAVPNWSRCAVPSGTEIFAGVVYGCEVLPLSAEGRGIVHWVRIDLAVPGIELYVTPLDLSAIARGWEYRLGLIEDVVTEQRLAVAINGTLFTSSSPWRLRFVGDLAKGGETIVSDYVVNHFSEHTYLLWFDDYLEPHLRTSKPPTTAEVRAAKWGIGGQEVWLDNGQVSAASDARPDTRTAVGIDQRRKLLFLAVAEWVSPHRLLRVLADLGARQGMLLDGGSSSAMAIGQGGTGIRAGSIYGGSRPVATFFGVRARALWSDSASTTRQGR